MGYAMSLDLLSTFWKPHMERLCILAGQTRQRRLLKSQEDTRPWPE
jgi:hypothetical protein